MERYVRTASVWMTDCGRFLFERTRSGWWIRSRFRYPNGPTVPDTIAETGILNDHARWPTREAALGTLVAVCEDVGSVSPGRLRPRNGWSTLDRTVELRRACGVWWAAFIGRDGGEAMSDRGFETRREAALWARARQRAELVSASALREEVAPDSP